MTIDTEKTEGYISWLGGDNIIHGNVRSNLHPVFMAMAEEFQLLLDKVKEQQTEIERLRSALIEIRDASGDDDDQMCQHYSYIQDTAIEVLKDQS